IGYDFGLTSKITLGAEANIAFSNIKSHDMGYWDDETFNIDREFELSSRLGYKVSDNALLFVKGGFANVSARYQWGDRASTWEYERSGWTVGGGVEAAVTEHVYAKV